MKMLIKLLGLLFFLFALGLFGLQMGFLLVKTTLHIEYIDNRLFYIINILLVICLTVALYLLITFTKKQKVIITSLIAVFIIVNGGLMFMNQSEIKNLTSISPDNKHIVSIKQNVTTGETIYYRSYYRILGRPMEKLANVADEKIKFQWLANDIAAITYKTTNDKIQQLVATYGYRGNTSYYYVGAEIHGTWQGESVKVVSDSDGITVTHDQVTNLFDWDQIEQFGTLAIVLKDNNEAKWTISLNENFELNESATKPTSGEITLYQATTEKNKPIVLKQKNTN